MPIGELKISSMCVEVEVDLPPRLVAQCLSSAELSEALSGSTRLSEVVKPKNIKNSSCLTRFVVFHSLKHDKSFIQRSYSVSD